MLTCSESSAQVLSCSFQRTGTFSDWICCKLTGRLPVFNFYSCIRACSGGVSVITTLLRWKKNLTQPALF